jgi:peroxiredoxin
MAKTLSNMIPLGTKAPDFILPDTVSHQNVSLHDMKPCTATVIMFLSNHCPYVKLIQKKLTEVAKQYQAKGIHFIAISSNDIEAYPDDSPEKMKFEAFAAAYTFPYLYDESQSVAKSYDAACTPDFFVFDKNLALVYRGRFDEATPGNQKPVTGIDLQQALDAILNGQAVSAEQLPSLGCNIKWK